ncbi:MAG TPA: glycoside hydrolase family 16 protein [Puia sp.]|nr:glycoside hydrolase family 16 protein [Puia sp.]
MSAAAVTACLLFFWSGSYAQLPDISGSYSKAPLPLQLLGTRSWIKASWQDSTAGPGGFNIYWSTEKSRPAAPNARVPASQRCYYIRDVREETVYYVWVEPLGKGGHSGGTEGTVVTSKKWELESGSTTELDIPSSEAVPEGMRLFWHDEFNDSLLDRNKWCTGYYSTLDLLQKVQVDALRHNQLPQAAYVLDGRTITLFVNDSLPKRDFIHGKKISSIQTYDWSTDENLLDNSRGGYFEVRVKRTFTGRPEGLNTAFWFDSPGPDLKYYLQEGTVVEGTRGIRPKGQLFEIDVFENLNAQFVLHGNVDQNGRFIHNLATDIAEGFEHKDRWVTHGVLWTPGSIKHYINGQLIKAYDNRHQLFSPDHFMNVFLGSYGKGGSVSMEVDYIRGYQWPVSASNELPNGDFEQNATALPWEGTGRLSETARHNGRYGWLLQPGDSIEQYVYLNNDTRYSLVYYAKGKGSLHVEVDDVRPVSGELTSVLVREDKCKEDFSGAATHFRTGSAYGRNSKTVRVYFRNNGRGDVFLDDIRVFAEK